MAATSSGCALDCFLTSAECTLLNCNYEYQLVPRGLGDLLNVGYLHKECSTSVYVVHQVISLHIGLKGWCQRNGTGVIHQNVDTTELE